MIRVPNLAHGLCELKIKKLFNNLPKKFFIPSLFGDVALPLNTVHLLVYPMDVVVTWYKVVTVLFQPNAVKSENVRLFNCELGLT